MGPVAALEPIKNLGTNGGGFFNVNGGAPLREPDAPHEFPRAAGHRRAARLAHVHLRAHDGPARAGLGALRGDARAVCRGPRRVRRGRAARPYPAAQGVDHAASDLQPGGNMEGKETRFGIGGSVLAAVVTSNGATGSYNSMHDSYTPVGGLVTIVNMLFGEVVFGGLGTGLYSLVLIALVGLFMAGLMVGRTPSTWERGHRPRDEAHRPVHHVGAAHGPAAGRLALMTDAGLAGLTTNNGAHGFTEILFAYASSMANNGQNFAGLSANTPFYNITTALAMMAGRFGLAIPGAGTGGPVRPAPSKPVTNGTLAHRHAALRRAHARDHPDRGRAQLPAGTGPGPHRRAPRLR